MDERELMNNVLDSILESNYENFDQLLFDNYFGEIVDFDDLTRIKTDNYGDAGNDYVFFTYNRRLILGIDDIEELQDEGKNNRVDLYFVQIKDTKRLDSSVPNKFIEFSNNMLAGITPEHYNEEINYNIIFFNDLAKKLVLRAKFYVHFYYFSRVGKAQLDSATDLNGRFETLKNLYKEVNL